jgi:hypothetical protein
MAEKKDPLRERIEELGRMNTLYGERAWEDWKPGKPPVHDHFTHGVAGDDEKPDTPKKG